MNHTVHHHVLSFPECRLHFDYPTELSPSSDFLHQRLLSHVEYDRIRWACPSASDALVQMHSDVPTGGDAEGRATISIRIWVCVAFPDFEGDVRLTGDLERANLELDRVERRPPTTHTPVVINGQEWLYRASARAYLIGLNERVFLAARVTLTGDGGDVAAREKAEAVRDLVIGSLRLERLEASPMHGGTRHE